jgi:hypothetical protein
MKEQVCADYNARDGVGCTLSAASSLGTKLGTDQWAHRAIAGRGILLDVPRHLAHAGCDYDASTFVVTVDDLEATLTTQAWTSRTTQTGSS